MMHSIDQALAELRRAPEEPVIAEIQGMVLELRYKGRRTADDIFEEVGPWEGESAAELTKLIQEARSEPKEPPRF